MYYIVLYTSSEDSCNLTIVKREGIILTMPVKMTMPGAWSIRVERVLCSSRQNHINARVNVFMQLLREKSQAASAVRILR